MTSSKEHNNRRRLKSRSTLLTCPLGNAGAGLPPARKLLGKGHAVTSHSDTPTGVSVLLGPAVQGCDSSAGVGSGCRCSTGVTLTGTLQQEAEKRGRQQFSPFFKDSHMLHQASSRNRSKASTEAAGIFGYSKEKKGSRHEPHCAHSKPQLENTAVSCTTWSYMQSDATLLPIFLPGSLPHLSHTIHLHTKYRKLFPFFPPLGNFSVSECVHQLRGMGQSLRLIRGSGQKHMTSSWAEVEGHETPSCLGSPAPRGCYRFG